MGELGQLGLGEDVTERKRPFPVKGALENCVIQVECGGVHTVALTNKGQVKPHFFNYRLVVHFSVVLVTFFNSSIV